MKQTWNERRDSFRKICFKARARFLSDLNNPMETQKSVLKDIISNHSKSEFGKEYSLNRINNISTFQKKLPIRTYEQFDYWINRDVQTKGGSLSGKPIIRWLRTSGTTKDPKKIPYTEYWMSKYRVPALHVLWGNYIAHEPELLTSPYAILDAQTTREDPKEFLNGIPFQGITNRNHAINDFDWQPPWYEAPWYNDKVPSKYEERMYYRLRYFLGKNLKAIMAINPSTLLALQHHLYKNSERLVEEIYSGTLYGKKIDDPQHALARKLAKLFQDENFNMKALWPNLTMLSCWTSATTKLYMPELEKCFPNVKILPFMGCGTEGIVTLPIDDHPTSGPLAINQGFYEFLPAEYDLDNNLEKQPETLLYDQLELDKEYHLIMTQGSGMCRYAVGDIYKVVGFYQGVPRIEFLYRKNVLNSFTGEKLTEKQLLLSMQSTFKEFNINNELFICAPNWATPPYYKILVEMHESKINVSRETLEKSIDDLLRIYNKEYDSKRASLRLDGIKLFFVKKGIINKLQEDEKSKGNATQFKYKTFHKDDSIFNRLLKMNDTITT